MHLSRFPRVRLAHLPTPLEPMDRLREALGGGPRLWIKRDDCTGLATGGNKTRKLEYLCARAVAEGADTLITPGAVQSNHCRQTAAAAAKLGMRSILLLEERVAHTDTPYETSGNILIDDLVGAETRRFPGGHDMHAACDEVAAEVRAKGGTPYVIPGGGSNPIGALGYVHCALELQNQALESGMRIDHVVHGTGSTGTQAGLVVGFEGSRSGIPVLGISVRHPKAKQEAAVLRLAQETADYVGAGPIRPEAVVADSDYVGPGYGISTPGMVEAIRLTAKTEAILLDPVYSGKGMAGLIGHVRAGNFREDENVVFLHTGGTIGLFAYGAAFGGA